MKAVLRLYHKSSLQGRYVLVFSIHEFKPSAKYPDGVKFGLICKDLKTGDYVLMDNHHPKGPHIHINNVELNYEYVNDQKLIEDFRMLVLKELGVKL